MKTKLSSTFIAEINSLIAEIKEMSVAKFRRHASGSIAATLTGLEAVLALIQTDNQKHREKLCAYCHIIPFRIEMGTGKRPRWRFAVVPLYAQLDSNEKIHHFPRFSTSQSAVKYANATYPASKEDLETVENLRNLSRRQCHTFNRWD